MFTVLHHGVETRQLGLAAKLRMLSVKLSRNVVMELARFLHLQWGKKTPLTSGTVSPTHSAAEGSDAGQLTLVFSGQVEAVDGAVLPAGHRIAALEVNTAEERRDNYRENSSG